MSVSSDSPTRWLAATPWPTSPASTARAATRPTSPSTSTARPRSRRRRGRRRRTHRLLSFLRARPASVRGYHRSKWAAEEMVRASSLHWTVLKPGVIYGIGDHMLDHLSHAFHTFPVFGLVGLREQPVRPGRLGDVARIGGGGPGRRPALRSERSPSSDRRSWSLGDAVRRVARVTGRRPLFVPLPIPVHLVIAQLAEWTMRVPLISTAQVHIHPRGRGRRAAPFCRLAAAGPGPRDAVLRRRHPRWLAGSRRLRARRPPVARDATDSNSSHGSRRPSRRSMTSLATSTCTPGRWLTRTNARSPVEPGAAFGQGETVTWRAKHFGITWALTSRIVVADAPTLFVDEQVRGPFRCSATSTNSSRSRVRRS